ncbi:hypothetical protein Ahy_A04g017276 [Arachis hypogaea]|uniref:Transmembrane protein n=1 Tax=Arachis hypogaea TaxID=3818 RepID=A0A445DAI4_ARAHY|nr:hypothetical protein Ahy_A05g022129 [Arachis hypogaea]RYR60208.1 hypothetical protein Ahy_A04g017276 [Arachis hypogaea]
MVGGGNTAAENSNHCPPTDNWARSQSRNRSARVPEWCGCGYRPILRWSGTESNSNKPFFGYPNYNIRKKTWCEESAGIEDYDRVNGRMKMNLAWRVGRLENDVRSQKFMTNLLMVAVFMMVVFLLAMCDKF